MTKKELVFANEKIEKEVLTGVLEQLSKEERSVQYKLVEHKGASKYLDYFAEVVPTPKSLEQSNSSAVICLLCSCLSVPKNYTLYRFKKSSSLLSHLTYFHKKHCEKQFEEKWKKSLLEIIPNKKIRISNKVNTSIKKKKDFFKTFVTYRYRVAFWLLMRGRPVVLVEDTEFKDLVIPFLNSNAPQLSRTTVTRAQVSICGFVYEKIKERLDMTKKYFNNKPFLSLQADCWTSKSNYSVLGISGSYFDVISNRVETIVFHCAPLISGKREEDLQKLLNAVLKSFNIVRGNILQTVSDDEGSIRNALTNNFLFAEHQKCLAHRLQTLLKHSFAFGQRGYKRDPFVAGKEWFDKIRKLVSHFTTSPKRTRHLKQVQHSKFDEKLKALGMKKFSATRWSGTHAVLLRLLRLKEALRDYSEKYTLPCALELQASDWNNIEQIAALLEPFKTITNLLQYKNKAIAGCKLPFLLHLQSEINEANKSMTEKNYFIYFINEKRDTCAVRITTDLAKGILSRLETKFDAMFGGFIRKMTNKNFYSNSLDRLSASLFLDPRLRDWFLGKKKYTKGSWWEGVKDWYRQLVVNDSEVSEDELSLISSEIEQDKNTLPQRFKTGTVMKRLKQTVNSEDAVLENYDKIEIVFPNFKKEVNIFDQFMGKDDEVLNPFEWWKKAVASYPSLEPLRKAAMIALTFQLASAFSESQFSFAERITCGVRASIGEKTLNVNQFVRFNTEVIKKELYDSFEGIHENALHYSRLIEEKNNNFMRYVHEDKSEIFNEEDSVASESTIEVFERQCPICNDTTLEKMERQSLDDSLVITCDVEGCERQNEPLTNTDTFYACTVCDEYDICKLCYDKKSQ